MKMLSKLILFAACLFALSACSEKKEEHKGCTDAAAKNYDPLATSDDGGCLYQPLELSQIEMDTALKTVRLGLTGVSEFENSQHGGIKYLRDIYENQSLGAIKPGYLVTKRLYYKTDTPGVRGKQLKIYGMYKREKNYYPEGGDFEYLEMFYDSTVDYNSNPNGLLLKTSQRGKLSVCSSCHRQAGDGDFVFLR